MFLTNVCPKTYKGLYFFQANQNKNEDLARTINQISQRHTFTRINEKKDYPNNFKKALYWYYRCTI